MVWRWDVVCLMWVVVYSLPGLVLLLDCGFLVLLLVWFGYDTVLLC